jgi:hypothetical protein
VHDLRHPNAAFLSGTRAPLVERNPVLFWKSVGRRCWRSSCSRC